MAHANSTVPGVRASLSAASAAGFAADLAWERCQEQAAIAYRAGDPITPIRLWASGLDIAKKHFGPGDPRLASSLTNQALVLRRRRQDYQARSMLEDALRVWDNSWRWIHLMTPGQAPNGAQDSDHLAVYEHAARAWFNALAQRGRESTLALERDEAPLADGLDEWFEIKPRRMSDLRRLLGAVLLIAPRRRI